MFQGFNASTIRYYEAIRKENSKRVHKENEALYFEGVKQPLEELYFALYNYFGGIDGDLLSNKRSCISSAYNDARFSSGAPIKEYFYIRFKLDTVDKKNALGFFFDASPDGYKYGLNIYHMNAAGMEKIRDYMLDNKRFATEVVRKFNAFGLLQVRGELYKKAHYPEENAVLRDWLERKQIAFIHEGQLTPEFYGREIFDRICPAFDSAKEVYFMLKEALSVGRCFSC